MTVTPDVVRERGLSPAPPMPHPERVVDPLLGGTDGIPLFKSLIETLT
jgi:phosphoribosylformylglycinamidine (FGAM) synthase-like amidotransferase family enzyme